MLDVKKKKKLRLILFLLFLLLVWLFHNWLSFLLGEIIQNRGISFGFDGVFFIFLNLGFLLWLTWFGWRKIYLDLGVYLILLGGWVNMIDRMVFGYVRDYWVFGLVYNNIADWIISIGVGVFVLELWKKK